jgi:hypothetical protein
MKLIQQPQQQLQYHYMHTNKIKILLADDELKWRNIFRKYWDRVFNHLYENEIIECFLASDAIEELQKTKLSHDYFDLVIADINFSENEIHESPTAGFEIIELAKKIHPPTKIIWYSAQSQETETFDRFLKESKFLKDGFIDYQIKKAWIVQSFKEELDKCLKIIFHEKHGLIFPLSKLFGTYNYSTNENDGFYKLTHSNFDWEEMKDILPNVLRLYEDYKIKDLLEFHNTNTIDEYLNIIENRKPGENEMQSFKSKFRFEFSQHIFYDFQKPLRDIGIECKNDFAFHEPLEIFAENDRLSRGFSTIYENIARHNFDSNSHSEYTTTHFSLFENELLIEIVSSGKGFNILERFNSKPTGGLRAIYDSFHYYCQLYYESDKIGFDVFQNKTFSSQIENGLKISLKFVLPKVIDKNNKRALCDG